MSEPPSPAPPPGPVVEVVDEQRAVAIDAPRWAALAAGALAAEGVPGGAECTLHFVDEQAIAALNAEHMHADGPTDVLSFPLDLADGVAAAPGLAEGPASADGIDSTGAPVLVGDVVVCPSVAARQAGAHAGSLDDELALLVVHGLLHLLGHDHAEPDERARMQARERTLLAALHGPLAGDPWADDGSVG